MFVREIKSPCYNCTPETGRCAQPINCHSYCERYLEFYKNNENNKQVKKDIKKQNDDYYAVRKNKFKPKER